MKRLSFPRFAIAGLAFAAAGAMPVTSFAQASSPKLAEVKQRGMLRCGVLANSAGQSMLNDKGQWTGFAIDFCKAVAAAVLGDPAKLEIRPAALGQQLAAIKGGEIDLLAMSLTVTMSREIELGYAFVGPTIYDGLTFMVPKSANVTTIKQLNGATICLQAGSLTEEVMPEYMRQNKITFTPLPVSNTQQVYASYDSKRCDAVTGDRSTLEVRRQERPQPANNVVLKETYAKSATGPIVRAGDVGWHNVVRYVHFATVTAEEMGITQANVDKMKSAPQGDVKRFLGVEGKLGSTLGLSNDFTVAVIKAVGNYGEIWDRNLGKSSPFQMAREDNKLVRDGGVLASPLWR